MKEFENRHFSPRKAVQPEAYRGARFQRAHNPGGTLETCPTRRDFEDASSILTVTDLRGCLIDPRCVGSGRVTDYRSTPNHFAPCSRI